MRTASASDEEQRGASDSGEGCVDGQRGRAFHEELVDAEKPEGGTPERVAAAGFEQGGNDAGEDGKEEQEQQQRGDGEALQDERDFAEEAFAEDGEQHALQGEDEGGGEQAAARRRRAGERRRKRARLGGSMAAGRTSVAKILMSKRKPAMKMAMAATRARKARSSAMGRVLRTQRSSRSGKNMSHSKTVTMPMATKE